MWVLLADALELVEDYDRFTDVHVFFNITLDIL